MGRAGGGDARRTSRCRAGLEQRLCDFADLVAQALANADAYEKLAASRARVVEVGDAERRRLERNLHDGAQQRLVSVALELSVVGAQARERPAQPPARCCPRPRRISPAGSRSCASWPAASIPAVLTERGLGPALDALLARAPVPVEIVELPEERLARRRSRRRPTTSSPRRSRTSAKYAQASQRDGRRRAAPTARATVTVSDDGVGGADPARGSGLRGLAARVEALNGRLDVDSPPGHGTRITAEIPLP